MAPAAMARLVASRRFTSKKGDLPLVIEINTRTILSLFRDVEDLRYIKLGWGDAEAAQLCEVLPLCASLEWLQLHGNPIGAAGQAALAAAIRGGGLGSLQRLAIDSPSAELRAACEGRGIEVG